MLPSPLLQVRFWHVSQFRMVSFPAMPPVRLIGIIDGQRGPFGFRGILGLAHAAQNPDFTFHRRALCGGRQATHNRALHSASASAAGCGRVLPRISAASYDFSWPSPQDHFLHFIVSSVSVPEIVGFGCFHLPASTAARFQSDKSSANSTGQITCY
jgi:hypothetical protein